MVTTFYMISHKGEEKAFGLIGKTGYNPVAIRSGWTCGHCWSDTGVT